MMMLLLLCRGLFPIELPIELDIPQPCPELSSKANDRVLRFRWFRDSGSYTKIETVASSGWPRNQVASLYVLLVRGF